jgi:mono/diheme cytochrome c family protein
MRERWARTLAFLTGFLVLLLSGAFAAIQNPAATPGGGSGTAAPAVAADLERGKAVYDQQGCARCHSVAGKGSPRSPLDGVGSRLDRAELHDWIVAAPAVQDDLSPRAVSAKQGYAKLPEADLEALIDYLASLTK